MTTPATPPTPAPQHTTSVDRNSLAHWRFEANNGFVVKDYTGMAEGDDPVVMVLKSKDIFDYIADAAQRKAKIAIYSVGPCVIDWS